MSGRIPKGSDLTPAQMGGYHCQGSQAQKLEAKLRHHSFASLPTPLHQNVLFSTATY